MTADEVIVARRRRRAAAARVLATLHANGALAEPERWDWDVLDRLPPWCLLDLERRTRLQCVAGAVLLAPEVRLWIDRRRLDALGELLGHDTLARLLVRADALVVAMDAAPDGGGTGGAGLASDVDAPTLERHLMAAGAAVLKATLHPSLPVGGLADALGESGGELPAATGGLVLEHAERLLGESPAPPADDGVADPGGGVAGRAQSTGDDAAASDEAPTRRVADEEVAA